MSTETETPVIPVISTYQDLVKKYIGIDDQNDQLAAKIETDNVTLTPLLSQIQPLQDEIATSKAQITQNLIDKATLHDQILNYVEPVATDDK